MSLTNPNKPVTEARLQEFYHRIKSYLGFTKMPSEDMDDVITPLPSVQSRYHKYSTEEHIVGEWIDGSKIYEKTISGTTPTDTNDTFYDIGVSVDKAIDVKAFFYNTSGTYYSGSCMAINSFEKGIKFYVQNNSSDSSFRNKLGINVSQSSWMGLSFYVTIQYTKSE